MCLIHTLSDTMVHTTIGIHVLAGIAILTHSMSNVWTQHNHLNSYVVATVMQRNHVNVYDV